MIVKETLDKVLELFTQRQFFIAAYVCILC